MASSTIIIPGSLYVCVVRPKCVVLSSIPVPSRRVCSRHGAANTSTLNAVSASRRRAVDFIKKIVPAPRKAEHFFLIFAILLYGSLSTNRIGRSRSMHSCLLTYAPKPCLRPYPRHECAIGSVRSETSQSLRVKWSEMRLTAKPTYGFPPSTTNALVAVLPRSRHPLLRHPVYPLPY